MWFSVRWKIRVQCFLSQPTDIANPVPPFDTENRLQAVFRDNNAAMLLLDAATGTILEANAAAICYYGYPRDSLLTMQFEQLMAEDSDPLVTSGGPVIARQQLASGATRSVELYLSDIVVERAKCIAVIVHDITERLEREWMANLADQILSHTREGVLVTDTDQTIINVNHAFTQITGYSKQEIIGQQPKILASGRHDSAFYEAMYADIEREGYWSGEIWNKHRDGEIYPELLSISRITDDAGNTTHFIGVFTDISKIKQSEQRLEKLAHYDALTNLPNRLMLRAQMEHAIATVKRDGRGKFGLLFLDLDQFKIVNDSQGHASGDELLCQVAERLKNRVRATDTVARLGGDEFVILAEGINSSGHLAVIACDIIEDINQPFQLKKTEAFIGTSIGIAVYPDDADNAEALLTYADTAMYRAKEKGRNTYAFYTDSITREADRKMRIANQLRRALVHEELVLFYQPQIDLLSGDVVGAEALIRWNHPDEGLLAPDAFVDIAEERGLIHEISRWVISRGCQQLQQWQQAGLKLKIALNVSAKDFSYDDFVEDIASIVELTDVDPSGLELELTESGIMENADDVLEALQAIRKMGINLSVDDFGTGYSSFAYLKYLPINKLKIDRTFIHDLGQEASGETIVSAVINLGKNFGLHVVAEGVESLQQQRLLEHMGCDLAQGYYFGKPVPPETFIAQYFPPQ